MRVSAQPDMGSGRGLQLEAIVGVRYGTLRDGFEPSLVASSTSCCCWCQLVCRTLLEVVESLVST